jgi:hypothetical protein
MSKYLQKVRNLPSLLCNANGHYEAGCNYLEKVKEYSGDRLYRLYPAKYHAVARMIADCLGTRLIADACGVSHHTVEAVRIREGIPIEVEKTRMLNTVKSVTRVCSERMLELAPTMNAKEAAIAFGIAAEKMQLLSGEATMILGKEETVKHASFNEMLATLPQADAHVVSTQQPYENDEVPDPTFTTDTPTPTPETPGMDSSIGSTNKVSLESSVQSCNDQSPVPTEKMRRKRQLRRPRRTRRTRGGGGQT